MVYLLCNSKGRLPDMKKLNKKGFTLIELMAVVVVLILVIFLALNKVNKSTKKAKMNTVKANTLAYVKVVNNFVEEDALKSTRFKNGIVDYSILVDLGINVSGTKPDSGLVVITNYEISYACFKYDKYRGEYSNGDVLTPEKKDCPTIQNEFTFAYTGTEQLFTVPYSGPYRLEVWGAQGGTTNRWYTLTGGYGGYSTGDITLNAGEKLYVNVGGPGVTKNGSYTLVSETYNGGGEGHTGPTDRSASSGGGATHIATKSGQLKTLENDKDKVIIVAGGGGGSWTCSDTRWQTAAAGHGGGYIGGTATARSNSSSINITRTGGTQEEGYAFGLGGITNNSNEHAGGGGGWYGGAVSSYAASGGSGYIGNSRLTNKHMAGYGVAESDEENTKTKSVAVASDTAAEDTAKKGSGYARITFLAPIVDVMSVKFKDYQEIEYIESTGGQAILTNIIPTDTTGVYAKLSSADISTDLMYFGSYETPSNKYFAANMSDNVYFGYNSSDSYQTSTTANTIREIKFNYKNDRKLTVDSTDVATSIATYSGQTYPMAIFGLNNNGTITQKSSMKLYELIITSGSKTIANYKPCYHKIQGTVGLCDLVSGNFVTSNDSSTFIKGADV